MLIFLEVRGYMLNKKLSVKNYFTKEEKTLWIISVTLIAISFLVFDGQNYLALISSLIGITALIFIAKGNPFGQILMIVFSVLYGIISFNYAYYGEMATYLGMTAPMAAFAFVSWIKNTYNGNKSEVKVNHIKFKEIVFLILLASVVTLIFYFILDFFNTANMMFSTISVTTSFVAVYLTFRRSVFYAIAYAANDIVLIFLWILASLNDISYISVVICFVIFFINDIYGFISWSRMKKRQDINN